MENKQEIHIDTKIFKVARGSLEPRGCRLRGAGPVTQPVDHVDNTCFEFALSGIDDCAKKNDACCHVTNPRVSAETRTRNPK